MTAPTTPAPVAVVHRKEKQWCLAVKPLQDIVLFVITSFPPLYAGSQGVCFCWRLALSKHTPAPLQEANQLSLPDGFVTKSVCMCLCKYIIVGE